MAETYLSMASYCLNCEKHTEHAPMVNTYATICTICGTMQSGIDRAKTESQTYTTPDGIEGQLVENTPDKAVFYVGEGQYKGYYHYDKRTQLGAIQYLPE